MRNAQTSDRISAIAARRVKLMPADLLTATPAECEAIAADVRSMAASLLRQDETKGPRQPRGLISRMLGR
jgi:hypothetical protein